MCVWLVGAFPWCAGVEFVPVDAGAEGGLAGVRFVFLRRPMHGVPFVFLEDVGGVGLGAFHIAEPFAGAAHVVFRHAAVVEQHAFGRGVEAAFDPVAVTRHGAEGCGSGFKETEQRAVLEEAFKPEVGTAQRQVGPPPSALGGGGPGVVRVVLGVGAFGQHALPAFVPRVGCFAPSGGGFGVVDAGEHISEFLEFPAGLQAWFGGRVGPGVALHVDQAALDPGVRPDLRACLEDAFHAVAYEHVGRRDLFEQGPVGGGALAVAPLPGEHFAVLPVDRGQQAPAVHPGAVGHDHAVHHAVGFDARFELPAPCAASPEGARIAIQPALRGGLEQPVQKGAQCGRVAS